MPAFAGMTVVGLYPLVPFDKLRTSGKRRLQVRYPIVTISCCTAVVTSGPDSDT